MSLELRTGYWHDPSAKSAFQAFMREIFGLDFSVWDAAGYWDDAYTPFSLFDGDTVVANVCLYLLDAVVAGESTRLAQISGVGTLEGWRRRGLSRELTNTALEWARGRQRGVFLFAAEPSVAFYDTCGFTPIDEFLEVAPLSPRPPRGPVVKLDPAKRADLERIHRYADWRSPVSRRFGVLSPKLFQFHVLYTLREHVHEIPDLECLVLFERAGDRLRVFDVVARTMPSWSDIQPYVAGPDDRTAEFHFATDELRVDDVRRVPLLGNHPFVRGHFPIANPVFPFTCRA